MDNPHNEMGQLTPQEQNVLNCLTEGWSYKEIAEHLNVSENTVRTHIQHIYKKLGVHNRTYALKKWHGRDKA
jgi:RNA polymerase sigma factor (sigma-70 family)